jgi:hypothetical protein
MDTSTLKQQKNQYMNAIDKILLTHRNTKLFLLMMTGPFLIGLKFLSWSIKGFVLLVVWKAA